jgi:hypothetical protein
MNTFFGVIHQTPHNWSLFVTLVESTSLDLERSEIRVQIISDVLSAISRNPFGIVEVVGLKMLGSCR